MEHPTLTGKTECAEVEGNQHYMALEPFQANDGEGIPRVAQKDQWRKLTTLPRAVAQQGELTTLPRAVAQQGEPTTLPRAVAQQGEPATLP